MGLSYTEALVLPTPVALKLQHVWNYINKERDKQMKDKPENKPDPQSKKLSFEQMELRFNPDKVKKKK